MAAYVAVEAEDTSNIYALNKNRGITNIGSHPDNDVVIQDASVMPFHLMIDHRQKPYRVMILNPDAEVRLNGVRLAGNDPKEVSDLNQLQLGRFILRCQDSSNGTPVEQIAVVPVSSLLPPPPPIIPTPGGTLRSTGTPVAPDPLSGSIPGATEPAPAPLQHTYTRVSTEHLSRTDDVILLELVDATVGTNVNQTAVFQLTVVNGGPIVAAFDIQVEGIPGSWVEILPEKLNLYERARDMVAIRITPPRDPSSLANVYPLRLVVTSPNYPGIFGEIKAELTIYPYHEFSVGNLTPRNQHASYTKKSGRVQLPLINYGNSPATFLVSAQDEENGCQFTLPIDETQSALVKQAEVKVRPGETVNVPIVITPHKRRVLRLQSKQYPYSVSTQSLNDPAAARTVAGSFTSYPLFGLIHVLLAILLLMAVAYLTLQPGIKTFDAVDRIIRLGEPAQLRWNLKTPSTNQRILEVSEPLQARQRQISIIPSTTITTYTLEVSNWLSTLLGMDSPRKSTTVLAIPNYPEITTFFVSSQDIYRGDEVIIKWDTRNASEVLLTVEGVTTTLKPEEFSGERTVKINNNTIVSILARNNSGEVTRSEYIKTKVANADKPFFQVTPDTVVKGEKVTVEWKVSGVGVESIHISPFEENLPASGSLDFYPTASMEFVLSVKLRDGTMLDPQLESVGVLDAPVAPKISFLEVAPAKLTSSGTVQISWSVTGETTNIVLTSNTGKIADKLPVQGFYSTTISNTTSFILIAYNGTLSDAQVKQVEVDRPKPVVVTLGVDPLSARVGQTVLATVTVLPKNQFGVPTDPALLEYPAVKGGVTISGDGVKSCTVDLTKAESTCLLTITKVGPISVKALYSGDDFYASAESEIFSRLIGLGNPVTINLYFAKLPLVVGEATTIKATVTDPYAATNKQEVNGKIEIFDATNTSAANPNGLLLCPSANGYASECASISFTTATIDKKKIRVRFSGSTFHQDTIIDFLQAGVPLDPATAVKTDIVVNPAQFILLNPNYPSSIKVGDTFDAGLITQLQPPVQGQAKDGIITISYRYNNIVDTDPTHQCKIDLSLGQTTCKMTVYPWSPAPLVTPPYLRELIAVYAARSSPANYAVTGASPYLVGSQTINVASTKTEIVGITSSVLPLEFMQIANVTVRVTLPNAPKQVVEGGKVDIVFIAPSAGNSTSCAGEVTKKLQPDGTYAGELICDVHLTGFGDQVSSFTATYQGNSNYDTSTSAPVYQQVNRASSQITSVKINGGSPSSSQGSLIPIEFSLKSKYPVTATPVGKILVKATKADGTLVEQGYCLDTALPTYLQISTIADPYTCNYKFTQQGLGLNISLEFVPDVTSELAKSVSAPVTHDIKKLANIEVSVAPAAGTFFGNDITFTCKVTDPTYIGTPTGICTVYAKGTKTYSGMSGPNEQSCTVAQVDTNKPPNTNTCAINFNYADLYTIDATYAGDNYYAGGKSSTSPTVPVNAVGPVNITITTDPAIANQPFIVRIQVLNNITGRVPTGWVDIFEYAGDPALACANATNNLDSVQLLTFGNVGAGQTTLTMNKGSTNIVVRYNNYLTTSLKYTPNFQPNCSVLPITVN